MMPKYLGAIFLSFCEGQHLLCMNMLRNTKPFDCDNYHWELSQTVFKSLPEYHEKNLTALQNLFEEMFKRFTANQHRVPHDGDLRHHFSSWPCRKQKTAARATNRQK